MFDVVLKNLMPVLKTQLKLKVDTDKKTVELTVKGQAQQFTYEQFVLWLKNTLEGKPANG